MRDGVAWKAVERSDGHSLLKAYRKKRGTKRSAVRSAVRDTSTDWLKGLLSDLYANVLREPLPIRLRSATRELEDVLVSSRIKR